MRFLRSRATPPQASPTSSPNDELEPAAIFRADGVTEVLMPIHPERLSDELNARAKIRVLVGPDWSELDPDDVISIAVQPRPEASANRMARRRHVLELSAPPYQVRGTAHMPAGADPGRYARAVPHRWLALTAATIAREDGDAFDVEVLLVNMSHVSRL